MIKKSAFILCLGVCIICACKDSGKTNSESSNGKTLDGDISYAFGVVLGSQFKEASFEFDYDALIRGFRECLEDKSKITVEEAMAQANTAYREVMEAQSEVFREEQTAFLAENSKKAEVQTTASGLQYEVITEGTGEKPQASDTVLVHYEGSLTNGTVFDSSYDRGEPVEFSLEGIIPGWTEGLQLMRVGSSYQLYIPSELAYGERGAGGVIPPYAALIFKVELLDIVK